MWGRGLRMKMDGWKIENALLGAFRQFTDEAEPEMRAQGMKHSACALFMHMMYDGYTHSRTTYVRTCTEHHAFFTEFSSLLWLVLANCYFPFFFFFSRSIKKDKNEYSRILNTKKNLIAKTEERGTKQEQLKNATHMSGSIVVRGKSKFVSKFTRIPRFLDIFHCRFFFFFIRFLFILFWRLLFGRFRQKLQFYIFPFIPVPSMMHNVFASIFLWHNDWRILFHYMMFVRLAAATASQCFRETTLTVTSGSGSVLHAQTFTDGCRVRVCECEWHFENGRRFGVAALHALHSDTQSEYTIGVNHVNMLMRNNLLFLFLSLVHVRSRTQIAAAFRFCMLYEANSVHTLDTIACLVVSEMLQNRFSLFGVRGCLLAADISHQIHENGRAEKIGTHNSLTRACNSVCVCVGCRQKL